MMKEQNVRLLDSQFAKFLARRSSYSGKERSRFEKVVCRLSASLAAGDTCLLMTEEEKALVLGSGIAGGVAKPLLVWGDRLYLERVFSQEKSLAERLKCMASGSTPLTGDLSLLDTLFKDNGKGGIDWQKRSAERALEHHLLIISGGPGTGKTSTVVKILALLLGSIGPGLRIGLAAPTGKAAMRLQESIAESVASLVLPPLLKENIPSQASTLHRLLGVRRFSPFFAHHAENPLPYDVVVVDEASMVDLALMSKLVDALRPGSRLVLLGDKNQLASVESGAVLADLIEALPENTVELKKSYRFDKGIKSFAEAVNAGDSAKAWSLIVGEEVENVSLLQDEVAEYGGKRYCSFMAAVVRARTVEEYKKLFPLLHSFKILCAVRKGRSGVDGVNGQVERYLTAKGYDCSGDVWYRGRPVMITRNDYALDLYNGDIGICLPEPDDHDIMNVWFERPGGVLQGLHPGRLSGCETVYALTVHKSQGSEAGEVLVVLPDSDSDLVTRELLYTAVTRAAEKVRVKGGLAVFNAAVARKIERFSGLVSRLQE